MERPLQISIRGMQHSAVLDNHIKDNARKLEQFYPAMIGCHVTIEKPHSHRRQGAQLDVRIELHVPGRGELVVNRQHAEDVYVALRDAFDAARRQLEDHIRLQRAEVKTDSITGHGHIKRILLDEGYGFIETPDGRELHFGRENVAGPAFERLTVGTPVRFIEEATQDGAQARRVSVAKHHFG